MSSPVTRSGICRARSRLDTESSETAGSTPANVKRAHSPATKKRLAESNAHFNQLQKLRGKELKEMIPEGLLEETKNVEGSNRDLILTLNATKVYIARLLEEKGQLQDQLSGFKYQPMNIDIDRHNSLETLWSRQSLRSSMTRAEAIHRKTGSHASPEAVGAVTSPELDSVYGRTDAQWPPIKVEEGADVGLPQVEDEDGTLLATTVPDISPHDSLLRQAVEEFIALTKESVMASQGTLDKKQIDRLNTIHDCIVDMVIDMRKA